MRDRIGGEERREEELFAGRRGRFVLYFMFGVIVVWLSWDVFWDGVVVLSLSRVAL